MKIALVHDYLSQDGGAEKVLQSLQEIWPSAPIFVLFADRARFPQFAQSDLRESFIRFLPFGRTHYRWYLPFMPIATERHNLDEFDAVISSTSAFAKGIITRPGTLHISYCHTPTRYLWTETHEYINELSYGKIFQMLIAPLIHRLRIWDQMSVHRVDNFVANSDTVRRRIAKYYRRDSDIIYPPVAVEQFFVSSELGDYFITGGRLVPYKRFDILITAANRLREPLIIFGDGPDESRLKKMAGDTIKFVGRIDDTSKAALLSRAKAFLHPQVEDFGITPVESMAAGRPVIAYGAGGATETVIPGVTGVFFYEQSWEAVVEVLLNFAPLEWDSAVIRARALKFAEANFKDRLERYVVDRYEEFTRGEKQCQLGVR